VARCHWLRGRSHLDKSDPAGTVRSRGLAPCATDSCRLVDTRNPDGPLAGPALSAAADRTFIVAGEWGIPTGARAISVNLTVTGPAVAGNLRAYPGGGVSPVASSINYSAGQTRGNNAIMRLGPDGSVTVRCTQATGTVHLVLDVNGFFQIAP
jgi:hypothetical protein